MYCLQRCWDRSVIHKSCLRVPNRFFGIRDLAFRSLGFGILEKMRSEIRDCNFERDTGFGNLTKRDSGNIILKSRDPGNPWTKMYE